MARLPSPLGWAEETRPVGPPNERRASFIKSRDETDPLPNLRVAMPSLPLAKNRGPYKETGVGSLGNLHTGAFGKGLDLSGFDPFPFDFSFL